MGTKVHSDEFLKPTFRRIRAYAFDPSLSLKLDLAGLNNVVYKVPWEDLKPGPEGEYIQIIDYEPITKTFYKPVDLDNDFVLAMDGYDPSESNPKFHQQMVYAVSMTTINNFERALGRKVIWAPRRLINSPKYEDYVQHLRIYPHALRDANAYYSPAKKAILFGYFCSTPVDETLHMPDSLVFTCLSYDIIVHEVTHAILDGIHNFYSNPTNPDVLPFHEAIADIVTLFQHFTFPEVLKNQIAKTRGDLASQNLLGQLAQEFGTAIGNYGSLRDAIGEIDPLTRKWKMKEASPEEYRTIMEPHARGSILVAAVFEAFINIYKNRVADLLRIASNGTGILPIGELHPDLVNRLAHEASKSAHHVLNICIRALDYCPPVDITFGDYLRAIITADLDLVPDDIHDYRLAFIDAFRKRGIYPEEIKILSVESLAHPLVKLKYNENENAINYPPEKVRLIDESSRDLLMIILKYLRDYANEIKYINNREEIFNKTKDYIRGTPNSDNNKGLHKRININFSRTAEFEKITGLAFVGDPEKIEIKSGKNAGKFRVHSFQIQNLRLVSRIGPDNNQINYVLFSLIQRCSVQLKDGKFYDYYTLNNSEEDDLPQQDSEEKFEFRGGCTLIFDLDSSQLKYAISKPLLKISYDDSQPSIDKRRAERQYNFQRGEGFTGTNEYSKYFSKDFHNIVETFNFLHH